jgi:hypothetical protein
MERCAGTRRGAATRAVAMPPDLEPLISVYCVQQTHNGPI